MSRRSRLAISDGFLGAFGRLPKAQQRGVRALISKFNADPSAKGLNYEPIRNARNARMRSLRIDRGYRAIVFDTRQGGLHLLLWAAKHDDAYDWAMRHDCGVNPETGAVQIYVPQRVADDGATNDRAAGSSKSPSDGQSSPGQSPSAGQSPGAASPPVQPATGAFADLRDRQLARLGVPPAMLPEVRALRDEHELDEMQSRLPAEAYESLFYFLAGESYEKLILEREAPRESVDTDDFETALGRDDSRARFVVADDEAALEAVLSAPLEQWRVFLHLSQRKLVERRWNGPVRVLGGAGTGKTVVAMHRARWLARQLAEGAASATDGTEAAAAARKRILFVTFTRNLAADIENNLRSICSPEEMERIEVTNLDRWVTAFLRRQGYDFHIAYGHDQDGWDRAMDQRDPDLEFADAFYADEWQLVVQAAGIETEDEYLRVFRAGRGTRLSRSVRAKVWPVFAEYRAQLRERGIKEVDDAYRDAAALLRNERDTLGADYAAVIVDEAQDLGAPAFKLIRSIVPEGKDDLFVVGDGHQRIYGRSNVVLGRCGINIRGRSRKLRLGYRTTEETRAWAVRLLEDREIDDLDGGQDDNRNFKSLTHGPEPRLVHLRTRSEQANWIAQYLNKMLERDEPLRGACIVTRTRSERDSLADSLKRRNVNVFVLERANPDHEHDDCARVATMHRVKGLEFDRVLIASANRRLVPLSAALRKTSDDVARELAETGERALVYVAATRAKTELTVLSYGRRSEFLGEDDYADDLFGSA